MRNINYFKNNIRFLGYFYILYLVEYKIGGNHMSDNQKSDVKGGIWARAIYMAEQTPSERNRYVDFLRAFSILAVVIGHWIVAAPYLNDGEVVGGHLLEILPWSQWLTWGFQVMPIFFLVGGFSNGVSWSATLRKKGTYAGWFTGRLQRLINPVLPLFLLWTVIAMFGTLAGVPRPIVSLAAELALIPVWFLAVYIMVTALVPYTYALWKRYGLVSFILFLLTAIIIDSATYGFYIPYVKWLNFAFVWLGIHQLGYAWGHGFFEKKLHAILFAVGGFIALILLVGPGFYPIAMIGVPGEDITNSMPPTIALMALGIMQTGIALSLETAGRSMLDRVKIWASVVLLNGMIMTIYLWHLTAFVLVLIIAYLLGGIGLDSVPGSNSWWLARPLWFALYIAALMPLIMIFARFEQAGSIAGKIARPEVPHWRLMLGLLLIAAGLAATAVYSIASPFGITGVRLWIVAMPLIGAAIVRFGPVYDIVERHKTK